MFEKTTSLCGIKFLLFFAFFFFLVGRNTFRVASGRRGRSPLRRCCSLPRWNPLPRPPP